LHPSKRTCLSSRSRASSSWGHSIDGCVADIRCGHARAPSALSFPTSALASPPGSASGGAGGDGPRSLPPARSRRDLLSRACICRMSRACILSPCGQSRSAGFAQPCMHEERTRARRCRCGECAPAPLGRKSPGLPSSRDLPRRPHTRAPPRPRSRARAPPQSPAGSRSWHSTSVFAAASWRGRTRTHRGSACT